MSAYDNVFQRPTSLFFTSSNKFNNHNNNSTMSNSPNVGNLGMMGTVNINNSLNMNDVFADEQEDQIVPDCSVAPKLDLSPMNEPWVNGVGVASNDNSCSHGFLTTAVHLSLQEVS